MDRQTESSTAKKLIQWELVKLSFDEKIGMKFPGSIKDTIYIKLPLMHWIDDNWGHTPSGLTKIDNIIAKILPKFQVY